MRHALGRLMQAGPLLVVVSLLAFAMMHLAPGGPTTAYAHNPLVSGEQIASIRRSMGLDEPLPMQYVSWLWSLAHGEWGYSLADGRPVLTLILERLPATLLLMVTASAVGVTISFPLGIVAATRQYSLVDHLITIASMFTWGMPAFWFALMAQLLFAVRAHLLPVAGMHGTDAHDQLDVALHLVLPALVLGLTSLGGWIRYLRSALLEAIHQPYVTTSRAKGGSAGYVLVRHVLPNAMIPLITIAGLDAPQLFTGSVVVETIFAWPGMGRLFYDSLLARDYPVEMGILMVAAVLTILGNLAADLLHRALDPRVRVGGRLAA